VDEERERPPDPGGPSGGGAPPGDPDYHLHTELGKETKRLATHPREEAHRLVEELREGETETTPLIALSGMALWIGVLVAIVIAQPPPRRPVDAVPKKLSSQARGRSRTPVHRYCRWLGR
jgi:hypothetical protein